MSRWADAGSWVGDGMRRESFFFRSGELDLFGSLYVAEPRRSDLSLVFCNSWGFEGNLGEKLVHGLAIDAMQAGGAAVTFHYPGFGDSGGEIAMATMEMLAEAAADAVKEAKRRSGEPKWTLAGFSLGATVASLAARRCETAEELVLIQPSLSPSRYLQRIERAARRAAVTGNADGTVHGYPLPRALLDSAASDDEAVAAALAYFEREVVVVRYEQPTLENLPIEPRQEFLVEGTWRFGTRDTAGLRRGTRRWLRPKAAGRAGATP